MSILLFIVITLLFLLINKLISQNNLNFIRTLSILDGISYFLYMLFCLGCLILVFQTIKLPILYKHPIWFKLLLSFTSLKLLSLKFSFECIKNHNNKARIELIHNLDKEDKILNEIKIKEDKIKKLKEKQQLILKDFYKELDELEKQNYSEEELQTKISLLTQKYDKLFEEARKDLKL